MTILAATCWPQVPPEKLRTVARAAEGSGLAELWLWEDCFWGGAMSTAAALLAWTDRLPVAIGVLPVPLRNVALTAMEVAALHRLFPGRVADAVRFWAAAGADKVVLHPGPDNPDPVAFVRFAAEQVQPLLA